MVVYKPAAQNPFEGIQAARWYHHRGMNLVPFSCTRGKKRAIEEWKPWQEVRQPWEEIANFPWHAGVAAINGIGDWRSIDIDEAHTFNLILDILDMLDLPPDYPWVVQSGSRKGYHLWFKSEGRPFDGTLYKEDEKGVYVAPAKLPVELDRPVPFKQIELRWARCCTILPPTIHPSGQRYIWIHGIPESEPGDVFLHQIEGMMRSLTTIQEQEQEECKRLETIRNSPPIDLSIRREQSQEANQKWAEGALEKELRILSSKTKGQRNPQLNTSAFNIGQIVGGGYLSESYVINELRTIADRIGLDTEEIAGTIKSGLDAGKKKPRHPKPLARLPKRSSPPAQTHTGTKDHSERAKVVPISGNTGEHLPPRTQKAVTDEDLVEFTASDAGNADAFYALHGYEYLYCSSIGWLHYTGTHWQQIENEIDAKVIEVLRKRRMAAVKLEREPVVKCAICDMKRVNGCREALKARCIVYTDTFDSDPNMLNCANGVVDLRTGKISPHHPSQRYTYCVPVTYNSDTNTDEWIAFLAEIVGGGPAMLDYLQMAVGYSITGHTSEECLFYLYGPTRSGKGTFIETLLQLFAKPLANMVDFNTFTAKRDGDTNNFDLAPLRPARIIFASESNKYQTLNPAKIKQITGGDMIWCSFKHKNMFSYRPQFTTWLISNHKVNADPDDDALWARVRVINFPNSFLGAEDRSLKPHMKSEANLRAVLAWAVEGAKQWYALGDAGLIAPEEIKEATQEHRDELDHIKQWIEECCVYDPSTWSSNKAVFESYTSWCKQNMIEKPLDKRKLAMSLQAKGCETGVQKKVTISVSQSENQKGVKGLSILASPPGNEER